MMNRTVSQALSLPTIEVVSVQDFFTQINWYGKVSDKHGGLLAKDSPYETVGQFFTTFPWQGDVNAVATDQGDAESDNDVFAIEGEPLTLEDLSALF